MINSRVRKTQLPLGSSLSKSIKKAYYFDAYQLAAPHSGRSALQVWLTHIEQTPAWMNGLMRLRNTIVALFGLKDLGPFKPRTTKALKDYKSGDRIGIFRLEWLSDQEIILVDNDKHLCVYISVYLENNLEQRIIVSTLVQVHNRLGKVYMLFITPVHKLIVPLLLVRFK